MANRQLEEKQEVDEKYTLIDDSDSDHEAAWNTMTAEMIEAFGATSNILKRKKNDDIIASEVEEVSQAKLEVEVDEQCSDDDFIPTKVRRKNPLENSAASRTAIQTNPLGSSHGSDGFVCPVCSSKFTRKDNLKRHMVRAHDTIMKDDKSIDARTICHFSGCSQEFYQKTKFIAHLKSCHNVNVATEHYTFNSEREFLAWKEKEELKNYVYFSRQRGERSGKKFCYSYYNCQHDGVNRAHRKKGNEERKTSKRNKRGSVKTGIFCPARLTVTTNLSTNVVDVTYVKSHNHPVSISNTAYQPIPKSVKADINAKLAIGVPVKDIYKDVRNDLANRDKRELNEVVTKANLISKKNISDINRRQKHGRRLHPDDSMSTYLLVKKLERENFNVVVVYKPQGEKTIIGPKAYDDIDIMNDTFVIGIQTKEQQRMFEKHCSKIVCIDSTHKTNKYEFPLVNILVPDEFGKGYPVGHLISNHADELTLRPFFEEIKKRCDSDVKINAVMTDDDNSGWNAFTNVFGDCVQLLCKWHVKKAWKGKIPLAGNEQLQQEIYQTLEILIDEKSPEEFQKLMAGFITKYRVLSPRFIEYFETYYAKRAEKWAMCYRNFPHGNTDTNMFAESFHNKLKTFYMERKPNKRLDDLINLLLLIEEDDFWRHKRDTLYDIPSNKLDCAESNTRHSKGIQISDIDVEQQACKDEWQVKSQSRKIHYKVKKIADTCECASCSTKCFEVACIGLCSHLYVCNCEDRSPLCKPFHKIHSSSSRKVFAKVEETKEIEEILFLPPSEIQAEQQQQTSQAQADEDRFLTNIEKLKDLINYSSVRRLQLKSINRRLEDMIRQAEAIAALHPGQTDHLPSMDAKSKSKPNEKLEFQWRPKKFFKTRKEKSRPECKFLQLSVEEKMQTREELVKIAKDDEVSSQQLNDETKRQPEIEQQPQKPQQEKKKQQQMQQKPVPSQKQQKQKQKQPQQQPKHKSQTANIIPRVEDLEDLRLPLITFNCFKVCYLSLFSLEINVSKEEMVWIKKTEPRFKPGWLSDEIISAFLHHQHVKNKRVYFINPVEALAVLRCNSIRGLLNEVDGSEIDFLFIPFNISGNHWILVVLDINNNKILVLDPMEQNCVHARHHQAAAVGSRIMMEKFNRTTSSIESVDHVLQSDSKSCGVYCCFYAQKITEGGRLNDRCQPVHFRRHIFEMIVGKCIPMNISWNRIQAMHNNCRICMRSTQHKTDWVQCTRCPQWYHCKFVLMTVQEADEAVDFRCS